MNEILLLTSWYHTRRHLAADDVGKGFLCGHGYGVSREVYEGWQKIRHHKMPDFDDIPMCKHCKRIAERLTLTS